MTDLSIFKQFAIGGEQAAAEENNRCVIYTRVSTTHQEDNTSLSNQAESCLKFAERNGYQIVSEFGGKGESAKTGSARKEYERMMKFVRKKSNNIRFIVFYSYDRFFPRRRESHRHPRFTPKIGYHHQIRHSPHRHKQPNGERNGGLPTHYEQGGQ